VHGELFGETKSLARGAPIVRTLVKMTSLDKTDVDVPAAGGILIELVE
jgi:hypothetical protein